MISHHSLWALSWAYRFSMARATATQVEEERESMNTTQALKAARETEGQARVFTVSRWVLGQRPGGAAVAGSIERISG